MLKSWTQLLPVFIYKWLARRMCEKVKFMDNSCYVTASQDILIATKE